MAKQMRRNRFQQQSNNTMTRMQIELELKKHLETKPGTVITGKFETNYRFVIYSPKPNHYIESRIYGVTYISVTRDNGKNILRCRSFEEAKDCIDKLADDIMSSTQ